MNGALVVLSLLTPMSGPQLPKPPEVVLPMPPKVNAAQALEREHQMLRNMLKRLQDDSAR